MSEVICYYLFNLLVQMVIIAHFSIESDVPYCTCKETSFNFLALHVAKKTKFANLRRMPLIYLKKKRLISSIGFHKRLILKKTHRAKQLKLFVKKISN